MKFNKESILTTIINSIAVLAIIIMPTSVKAVATSESTLVWSDEFNGNSLDSAKWNADFGYGIGNEFEYYTNRAANISVHDGALHITARKEKYFGNNYTSGRITTHNKFYFKYGHVEARISLPSSPGMFPAFWTLNQNDGLVNWPYNGEIDIIETVNDENKVYGTCHWDANGRADYGTRTNTFDITKFHTYVLDWDEKYIRLYVDGNKYYEIYIENGAGDTEEFHSNHYLLFNVAVGGDWPGFNIDDNRLPQSMKVDYIRVYQDKEEFTYNPNAEG